MARRLRIDRGGIAYHLLNRRVGRLPLFEKEEDCRYLERNPLRANLVERAEDWPWCSLTTLVP